MRASGAHFENPPLDGGPATAVSMINVTPDGQRTMCTYLGASVMFTDYDVDAEVIENAKIVYLEGYLFDAEAARRAFAKAAGLAGSIVTLADLLFANVCLAGALFVTSYFDAAAEQLRPRVTLAAVTRG